MTIDLYYTPASGPCRSVLLTANLLGLELNLKELDLMKGEHLAPEFVKINPQHTVPTIVDNGFVLWESYAITTYLVQQYGKDDSLYPRNPKKKAVVNQRLYFDEGTLYSRFGDYYYSPLLGKESFDATKLEKAEEAVKFLDTFLEGHEFVAGDNLTVADISLITTVSTFEVLKFDYSPYKNVTRWYAKVKAALPEYEAISGKEFLTKEFEKFRK